MDKDTLQIRANMAEQSRIEKHIKSLRDEIVKSETELVLMKNKLEDTRRSEFYKHYNISARQVMEIYSDRFAECCYQGGRGYQLWLPYHLCPHYHHCVIDPDKYQKAQPTQQELDAYWAMYGKNMKVTKEMHTEKWGN